MSLHKPVVQPINVQPIVHEDLNNPLYSTGPSTSFSNGRTSLGYDKTQVVHSDKKAEIDFRRMKIKFSPSQAGGITQMLKVPRARRMLEILKMFDPPEAREPRAVRKKFLENEIQDETERDGLVHYHQVMSSSQGIIRRKEGSAMETGTGCERDQYRFEMEDYAVW